MDWDDIRTFLAIARAGTLSGAARTLGLTQPTMGRRLAAMEARLGARLLQRTPDGYVLTQLGEAVLGNAERIEAEAISVERAVSGRDVALEGVVRLTTVDTLAARILTPAIAALQQQHPGIAVELVPATQSLNLSKREADIALRMARFEGHDIVSRRVGTLAVGLYAGRAYLERHGSPTAGQGEGHAVVTVLDDQLHLPEARLLAERLPGARMALRTNSRDVHLWAAKNGIGIACLARFRADTEADLVHLFPEEPPLTRDIWLGVHRDLRHTPRIRAVIDAVTSELKRKEAILNPAAVQSA